MDPAMQKLVSARLQAQAPGPHPDPELLAAYVENGLSPPDRNSLLAHLAACADCRDAVYLAMPEADMQPALRPAYKAPRLALRWATLAASVVIVGTVLLTNREMFYRHSLSVQPYSPAPAQMVAELKEPVAAGDSAETRVPAAPAESKVRPQTKHMTAKPRASMQFDQFGQVHLSAPHAGASAAKEKVAARVTAAPVGNPQAGSADKLTPQTEWGLSPDGNVQRSLDAGKTWQIVRADASPFRAINAIGDDVWVGGNAGALYHSADSGQTWTKIEPVSTDDIVHIEFTDSQHGLVNTASGQVWSTSDGGRSWQLK